MNCPKCGNSQAKYKESRRKNWHGTKGFTNPTPRTNFNAECSKCGLKWNTQEGYKNGKNN